MRRQPAQGRPQSRVGQRAGGGFQHLALCRVNVRRGRWVWRELPLEPRESAAWAMPPRLLAQRLRMVGRALAQPGGPARRIGLHLPALRIKPNQYGMIA